MLFRKSLCFLLLISAQSYAQQLRFDDPNILFRDTLGNSLSTDAAMDLVMNYSVTIRQTALGNGKSEVILIPSAKKVVQPVRHEDQQWLAKWKGATLPEFNLADLNSNSVTNELLRGKIVVINFWFMACKPCVREMPDLNQLVEKYSSDKVIFLAPSFDSSAKLQDFFIVNEFAYTVLPELKLIR